MTSCIYSLKIAALALFIVLGHGLREHTQADANGTDMAEAGVVSVLRISL